MTAVIVLVFTARVISFCAFALAFRLVVSTVIIIATVITFTFILCFFWRQLDGLNLASCGRLFGNLLDLCRQGSLCCGLIFLGYVAHR